MDSFNLDGFTIELEGVISLLKLLAGLDYPYIYPEIMTKQSL